MQTKLNELLDIEYPVIMAPMFLVSNTKMIIEGLKNGITGAIPALNYRTDNELRDAINEIKSKTNKPFGVNLIVNKSNPKLHQQLDATTKLKVGFVITSLGNPKTVIDKCKPLGIKVFCDVTNLKQAKKVEELGADGLIAVNNKAGGHSGQLSANELIPLLKKNCKIPVISAGGVATKNQLDNILKLGADGVSVGTPFIVSHECDVSDEYKKAVVNYGAKDIVTTNKMSGSPLSVINTPYVQKIGTKANLLERLMLNRVFKKLAKKIIFNNGMRTLHKSALKASYKTVWVAGVCIEQISKKQSVKQIIENIVK